MSFSVVLEQVAQCVLTYEDVGFADGEREYLVDILQKRYAIKKDAALRQVTQFEHLVT